MPPELDQSVRGAVRVARDNTEHMFVWSLPAVRPMSSWEPAALPAVPGVADAGRHAAYLRRLAAVPADAPLLDLDAVCAIAGIEVQPARLRGAAGGIEAALTPLPGNRFAVSVDAEPRGGWARFDPGIPRPARAAALPIRAAHEIAHTLFYVRSGDRPRRRFPVSRREEAFCDRFAQALLLPDRVVASSTRRRRLDFCSFRTDTTCHWRCAPGRSPRSTAAYSWRC